MTKIDLWGNALLDYQSGNYSEDLITWTNISTEDVLPLPYLFRDFEDMPMIEQMALNLSKGKILDVGCGAGSHSLWLQKNGIHVKAIDESLGAIKVSKGRGLKNAVELNILDEKETFDTILLLMNGTGIFKELKQVPKYLAHLKSLLHSQGQILIDSSDISYMYEGEIEIEVEVEVEDEGETEFERTAPKNKRYYGELDYYFSYKGITSESMKWLYLDFKTLKNQCEAVGLKCEKILEGPHFDYLARLTI